MEFRTKARPHVAHGGVEMEPGSGTARKEGLGLADGGCFIREFQMEPA